MALTALEQLLGGAIHDDKELALGISNLATLPEFNPQRGTPSPVPGSAFAPGVIGFRRNSRGGLRLATAGGKAMVRYLALEKLVVMVERMYDREGRTSTVLENHSPGEDNRPGQGQVLGRINPRHSAICIVHGVVGKAISSIGDIARQEYYYLDRRYLTVFYLAAKFQLSNQDTLESLIAAFDGWCSFDIPLNPLNPHDQGAVQVEPS